MKLNGLNLVESVGRQIHKDFSIQDMMFRKKMMKILLAKILKNYSSIKCIIIKLEQVKMRINFYILMIKERMK
jgi:hypothetical protein